MPLGPGISLLYTKAPSHWQFKNDDLNINEMLTLNILQRGE